MGQQGRASLSEHSAFNPGLSRRNLDRYPKPACVTPEEPSGKERMAPENTAQKAKMQSAGQAGALHSTLVAGTGFEPVTFGL